MITREFLLKEGFANDGSSPIGLTDFFCRSKRGGYISVRFHEGEKEPYGMYAYFQTPDHCDTRKVVLNDTIVTDEDFEMAKKLCRFE